MLWRSRGRHHTRARGNVVNPRAGSVLQHARAVTKEKTAEVLGKHGGGTRRRDGSLFPKDVSSASAARIVREWTSRRVDGGGAIFGQSQERKPVALR